MEDKMQLKSETAYFMMLQEGEEARVYLKDDVDAAIAAKDAEIARLKALKSPDIADVIGFENVQLKYLKGFLDGMCTALNCSYQKEGDYWVIRDGRKKVIVREKEAYDD